jgi:hypothetical protein
MSTQNPLSTVKANEISTMQERLLKNLQKLIIETQSNLNIEGFQDISEKSIILNPESYPEVSDYADVYNKNIALLDDPRNMINASFNTYTNIQDKKMKKLNEDLQKLYKDIQNNEYKFSGIKGFKSMNNSQILNVEEYYNNNKNNKSNSTSNNPTSTNSPSSTNSSGSTSQFANIKEKFNSTTNNSFNNKLNGASEYPNYLIYGNNGCLQYEPLLYSNDINGNPKPIPATWSFKPCNANEPKQQFVSKKINDRQTYNSFIQDDNNANSRINSINTTTFGFNVVNPINNQDQCLQLNNDGLSVMPCHLEFDQRFRAQYNTVLP